MPWIIVLSGYLIGAIPTGYIAGHIARGGDIRKIGDENMGAANVFRELGHRAGVIVGVIDAIKGALVVFIAQAANMSQPVVMLAGAAAVIGHNWPVFLGFRGGRGVSTTIGILCGSMDCPSLKPRRGLMIRASASADMPALTCTTIPPAKSSVPSFASQPPLPHTQCATGA